MKLTPLYQAHIDLGAKMCGFAGYEMPIQYDKSIIAEHEWVRGHCGIFDVSHMGQLILEGEEAADFLATISPTLFHNIPIMMAKYTVLLNKMGGIIDDMIVTRLDEKKFSLVVNASRKAEDIEHITTHLPDSLTLTELDQALIAVQGPTSEKVLSAVFDLALHEISYMRATTKQLENYGKITLSRLGYTGEDGFEISIPNEHAPAFWQRLLSNSEVRPIGLAARDSLRLEMGYALYGNDINTSTSPIEADLGWVISKDHDNFFGADRILKEMKKGTSRKLVGLRLVDKGIARHGATIHDKNGDQIGEITSGTMSPSLKEAICMGYVHSDYMHAGQELFIHVRSRPLKAIVTKLPFVSARTKKL